MVAHLDNAVAIVGSYRQLHRGSLRGMAEYIAEEISDDLGDLILVGGYHHIRHVFGVESNQP